MTSYENDPTWSFTPDSLTDGNSPPVNSVQPGQERRQEPENEVGHSIYNMDDNEPLQNAVEKFKETGEMIHIVKQELRWHLLYKRSKEGKDDIEMDEEEDSPKDYKLREEEITKIKRRREQNRMAAQRCRMRKKSKMIDLEESLKRVWRQFQNSQEENSRLRVENSNLKMELQQHRRYSQNLSCYSFPGSCLPSDNYLSTGSGTMPVYTPGGYIPETVADLVY